MDSRKTKFVLFLVAGCMTATAVPMDSLIIEGYYTKGGHSISNSKLANFLLDQDASAKLADASKGYRVTAFAVGAPMWCIATGISVYQGIQCYKALKAIDEEKPTDINSITGNISSFAIPLLIGTEITAVIQSLLSTRADYALRRAALAFNSSLYQQSSFSRQLDHQINEVKGGWYMQDGILMPSSVMYCVLKDNRETHPAANWSLICNKVSYVAGFTGVTLISLGIIGFFQEEQTRLLAIDPLWVQHRNIKIGAGIGLSTFAILTSFVSIGIREKAIKRYNETILNPPSQSQPQENQPQDQQGNQ